MSDTGIKPRCEHCHFWMRLEGERKGRCHRFPPTPYNAMHSSFAESDQSMWCGEFKERAVLVAPVLPAKGLREPTAPVPASPAPKPIPPTKTQRRG